MTNCILAGVGGQGTVLASKLIAGTAIREGCFARTAETIGMAQRGGCVVSHVRIGEDAYSPILPLHCADLLIGFEPAEAVRCLPYLKKGGAVVANTKAIKPVTASLSGDGYDGAVMIEYLKARVSRLTLIDGDAVCSQCGSPKVLNVALLGAACAAGALPFSLQALEAALMEMLAPKFIEVNRKALELGALAAGGE